LTTRTFTGFWIYIAEIQNLPRPLLDKEGKKILPFARGDTEGYW